MEKASLGLVGRGFGFRPIRISLFFELSTPSRPSKPTTSPTVPPLKDSVSKDSIARAASPARNKVELRQFGPVSGSAPISSRLSESADLSDAFRLVVEQVSKELAKVYTHSMLTYNSYRKSPAISHSMFSIKKRKMNRSRPPI